MDNYTQSEVEELIRSVKDLLHCCIPSLQSGPDEAGGMSTRLVCSFCSNEGSKQTIEHKTDCMYASACFALRPFG